MIVFPNAKINLGLNVVERRADGYHNLETVFYPIPLEDILEVVEAEAGEDDVTFTPSGIVVDCPPEKNLVVRAYRLLQEEFTLPRVHIYMYKHIPSGAGMGGGSADATYMMRLLREMCALPLTDEELEARASRLGADCAFFVRNRPTFATGIGDVFTPLPDFSLKGYRLVVVKPDVFVSTRDAFSLIRPHYPEHRLTDIITRPVAEWREAGMVNDFEPSVFARHPQLADIKRRLYAEGALYAAMSGSGSSMFGLFAADAPLPDLEAYRRDYPGCFAWESVL